MMERGVEQVRHYLNAIPIGAGPQGLWEFFAGARSEHEHSQRLLGELSHLGTSCAGATHACDPSGTARGGGGDPQAMSAPAAAECFLHSVIAGATMQWAVDPDGELADHVLAQIAAILCV